VGLTRADSGGRRSLVARRVGAVASALEFLTRGVDDGVVATAGLARQHPEGAGEVGLLRSNARRADHGPAAARVERRYPRPPLGRRVQVEAAPEQHAPGSEDHVERVGAQE